MRLLSYICLMACCICCVNGMAQTEEQMVVHMKDGSLSTFNMANVSHVELITPAPNPRDEVAEVGGTVATGVDLGLSVVWADHNVGAADQTGTGKHVDWSLASGVDTLWGPEWRLPTSDEWEELYSQCQWSWEVRNGIGGRVVTGPSGASIFIPASGVAFGDNVLISGCVGIYWTATTTDSSTSSAYGMYFDSANIYTIEYPLANTFSVRPVRSK